MRIVLLLLSGSFMVQIREVLLSFVVHRLILYEGQIYTPSGGEYHRVGDVIALIASFHILKSDVVGYSWGKIIVLSGAIM